MKNAENVRSCLQRDSTECEGYAGAQSAVQPGNEETAGRSQKLLEAILYRDNMNRAYKRVKANKGAPGVDGMTVEEALPWLKEHGKEMTEAIRSGKYKPTAVRRKEIPKPDGECASWGFPRSKTGLCNRQSLSSSCHCMNRSFRKGAMATGQEEVRRMPSSRFGDMRMKGMNGQYSSI